MSDETKNAATDASSTHRDDTGVQRRVAADGDATGSGVPAGNASAGEASDDDLEAQLAYENLKQRREAKKRKRIIILAVVGVVALVGIIVFLTGKSGESADSDAASQLVTGAVYQGDFSTTVTANGATEPVSSTVVTPEVDGIIENLQVQEGSVVSEGDVLFTLKNEELDKIYRDAQAEVESAERAVNRANKAVEDAVAAYNKAVDDYNGAQEAPSGGDPASGEAATFDEASLRAAVTSAEDAYNDAQVVLESARSKLDDAESNLDKRTVRAPVSGTIVSMSAQNGAAYGSVTGASAKSAPATSNEPLIQISDLSKMKVTVQVNEVDISSISVGQQAKATFSAIPGLELGAVVERIASVSTGSGSTDGSMGGVVTYAVDLVIPEPDAKLKPGMTATVNITTQSVPNALIVPTTAISDAVGEAGAKSVTVVTDVDKGEMHEVPVEVIEQNTSEAAVKGDLHDGDLVLLSAGGVGSSAGAGVVV